MKKAILIVGIIWAILCLLLGIFEIVYAIFDFSGGTIGGTTLEPDAIRGTANLILGIWLLVGACLSCITVIKRNSNMSRKHGITLGVFAIIFGAEVPGILFIVDSAKNRQ